MAAGETLIRLGYTEPEGGSDVFACKTRSVRDGDEWIINGQKMFTTFAHRADYCFLLTRTDPESHGPCGLTMFLVSHGLPRNRDPRPFEPWATSAPTSSSTAMSG